MVQIRILGKDMDDIMEWSQRITRLAHQYTDTGNITYSGMRKGREGDWIAYVRVKEERPGSPQQAAAPPAPGLGNELRNINIYTALGQLWGLAEAIIGDIEPDVTDLLQDHVWSTIGPNRRDRIRWLYDSLPQDYVLDSVRQAKEDEKLAAAPMVDIPGHYWPKFFYLFALVNPDTRIGQAVIKEFINPDPPPVVRLGN